MDRDYSESHDTEIVTIGRQFSEIMMQVMTSNGIHLTQDTSAPEQASFVVPNLGITIVPLVYGDHHSWNLAYLSGETRNVPTHRHRAGVEIHLGYGPLQGETILGDYCAEVTEGYGPPVLSHYIRSRQYPGRRRKWQTANPMIFSGRST